MKKEYRGGIGNYSVSIAVSGHNKLGNGRAALEIAYSTATENFLACRTTRLGKLENSPCNLISG